MLVVLDDEELDSLEPEPSRDIELHQFVDAAAVGHQWYDRQYWVGPDGDGDAQPYFALVEALADRDVEGIVRWAMRKKRYSGALRAERGYLSLITLRSAEEIISAEQLPSPAGRPLDKSERDLAGKLIDALAADFDPVDYHDDYRERVRDLIRKKRDGNTVEVVKYQEKQPTRSLAESLRASLQQAR